MLLISITCSPRYDILIISCISEANSLPLPAESVYAPPVAGGEPACECQVRSL